MPHAVTHFQNQSQHGRNMDVSATSGAFTAHKSEFLAGIRQGSRGGGEGTSDECPTPNESVDADEAIRARSAGKGRIDPEDSSVTHTNSREEVQAKVREESNSGSSGEEDYYMQEIVSPFK